MKIKDVTAQLGLYYMVVCVPSLCKTFRYSEVTGAQRDAYENFIDWVQDYRTMSSIALVTAVLCCFLIGLYMCQSRAQRFPAYFQSKMGVAILAGFLSGSLAIASAAKMGERIIDTKNLVELIDDDLIIFKVPYSLVLTGSGGLFILCVAFVLLGYLISELKAHSPSTGAPGFVMQQNGGMIPSAPNFNMYNPQYGNSVEAQTSVAGTTFYNGATVQKF